MSIHHQVLPVPLGMAYFTLITTPQRTMNMNSRLQMRKLRYRLSMIEPGLEGVKGWAFFLSGPPYSHLWNGAL